MESYKKDFIGFLLKTSALKVFENPVFYAPGFIAQGGKIEAAAKVAGDRFHGIVGRGIYQAKDMHAAAVEHTSQL